VGHPPILPRRFRQFNRRNTSIISRADEFIFPVTSHPAPSNSRANRKEQFEQQLRTWSEIIGFGITVDEVEGGLKVIIEAKTEEAKNRLLFRGCGTAE
jgi:hypothetical protein